MKHTTLGALLLALLFTACNSNPVTTVKINNQYSLDLPDYVTKAAGLHKVASLQYSSAAKQLYVLVVDESKAEFNAGITKNPELGLSPNVDGYSKLGLQTMAGSTRFQGTPTFKTTTINGLPARTITLNGTVKSLNGYWNDAYVEGADTYYHIVTWTTAAHKEEHQKVMQDIINSFKEYPKNKKAE
jgi:hypothetical protein